MLGDVLTNAANIVSKGRLGPGQMVCADLTDGSFSENAAISREVAAKQPYKQWLEKSLRRLEDISPSSFYTEPVMDAQAMLKLQAANGMGAEDAQMVVEGMAAAGVEPTYCMGDDIPLAVLSDKPHMLYDYFKQRFAQVGGGRGRGGGGGGGGGEIRWKGEVYSLCRWKRGDGWVKGFSVEHCVT